MRSSELKRFTGETKIKLNLNIDGMGKCEVNTGIGFLDHMLELFTKHGCFDIKLTCEGDLYVDSHHTIEDIGIVLGQALKVASGDLTGVNRYSTKFIPMDEALVCVSLDFSGRPYLVYNVDIDNEDVQLYEEFFRAVSNQAGITLHIRLLNGKNAHHIIEAMFKAVSRAMREALEMDSRIKDIPSTKGFINWEKE